MLKRSYSLPRGQIWKSAINPPSRRKSPLLISLNTQGLTMREFQCCTMVNSDEDTIVVRERENGGRIEYGSKSYEYLNT
jgi:hypothetical protein